MKWILFFLACFHVTGYSVEPRRYTAEWLQRGLAAYELGGMQGAKLSDDQTIWALEAVNYYAGFIHGINMSMIVDMTGEDVRIPDEEMFEPLKVAPKILAFIHSRKSVMKENLSAQRVLVAWYLTSHSKATNRQKLRGETILYSED